MNQERILTPELQVLRTADEIAIKNIMGRFSYLLFAREYEKLADLFAVKTEGVRAQIANWGIYKGPESVRKLFVDVLGGVVDGGVGCFYCDPINTPAVEVAGDGKTAKGLWLFTGAETVREDDGHQGYWSWGRYAVDFVKEDGRWKIWHFTLVGLFRTKFGVSWVDAPDIYKPELPDNLKPDEEGGYHWYYRTDVETENKPAPPEPYWTFDETFSY